MNFGMNYLESSSAIVAAAASSFLMAFFIKKCISFSAAGHLLKIHFIN